MPFPARLHHQIPGWADDGSVLHIRLRAAKERRLIDHNGKVPGALLDAARFYHEHRRWYCRLLLVMPDHVHAMLAFPPQSRMSAVIGSWRSYRAKSFQIGWQEGYFDHRLRSRQEADECGRYIRQNPVRAGLAIRPEDWPWVWWPTDLATPE